MLHHPASLPGVLWTQSFLTRVAAEGAGCTHTYNYRSPVPGVAQAGFQAGLFSPNPRFPAPSETCYPEAVGENLPGTEPQRVERVAAFPNLVVPLFFSPRKCLVTEIVVFIYLLPLPLKKNLLTLKCFVFLNLEQL